MKWRKIATETENTQLITVKPRNKFTKIIEYILSSRWYVLLVGIILLLKTIFFYGNTVFNNDKIWLWSVRQTSFFIVIIVFPLLLFKKSVRRFRFGILINLIISIILFADELYYTYASNILSVMQARKYAIQRRNYCGNTNFVKSKTYFIFHRFYGDYYF